jgi:hypothetical protein
MDAVATFCSITGASPTVAEYYLESCNHDLDRSVDFYFQNPPDTSHHRRVDETDPRQARSAAAQNTLSHHEGREDEDDELQRALAASLREDIQGVRPAVQVAHQPTVVDVRCLAELVITVLSF